MIKKILHPALLLFVLSSLFLLSCKKDFNGDNNNPAPDNPFAIPASTPVDASLSGFVVDENNNPVNGAIVNAAGSTATTDARGMFSFSHITLDKYMSAVTVNKAGYFKAVRSFSANESRNFVTIKLLPKTLTGTVSSSAAGSVSLPNGTGIAFQANGIIVKSTGAAYTGTVNVFAAYIDPTSPDISAVVPGSFMGRDANNLYVLQSTGMIAVDLESPAGEPLQLAPGYPASISLPIPSSLLGKAPATIDTWSLNDQGVWQKEGTATRSGDHYEMEVSHFSFWNCDVPTNAIYLNLHVQDQAGNALPNMLISLSVPNNNTWWGTAHGYTDSLGNVSGLVPANQVLTLSAFPNIFTCNSPISTQSIGPFTTNTTLTVSVTINSAQTYAINGTAVDCNNQPVQNGTAVIYSNTAGYQYIPVVNGAYSVTLVSCSPITSVSVTVIDYSTTVQVNSGNITMSGNSLTVPVLNVCGGTQPAVFTFGSSQGVCSAQTSSGVYVAGTPLTPLNLVGITVNVSTQGAYSINTTSADGISFSANGTFTSTGIQTVYLTGSGTPVAGGTYTFQASSGGITGCDFTVAVTNAPPPRAIYDLGGASCSNTTVAGTYTVGIPIFSSASNTVSLDVNVLITGTYSIRTQDPNNGQPIVNGLQFSDSGYFSTTGPRTIVLRATGTPASANTFTYQVYGINNGNGSSSCSFTLTPVTNPNAAVFTFVGAPNQCQAPVVTGTYTVGSPIGLNSHTVTVMVNVTTAGTYAIQAGMTNGINFSRSSIFTSTGVQALVLQGFGTPTVAGTYTFTPYGGGVTGCPFTLQVN